MCCCLAPRLWPMVVLLLLVALVAAGCQAKTSPGAGGQADETKAVFSSPISPVATKQPETDDTAEKASTPLLLPNEAKDLVAEARNRLTQIPDAGITDEDIEPVAFEVAQWPDTSLGCPREGMEYSHVVTPGYVIVFLAKGRRYEFHTNTTNTVVLCQIDGDDAMKVLQP
jgi:hypothetical protein